MPPLGRSGFIGTACRPVFRTAWPTWLAVALVLMGTATVVWAEPPRAMAAAPLWISDTPLEDGKRLLIVIDSTSRHAAVYHVDPVTGSMVLRSTRDISWDLRLDEFNAQEPKPTTLRKMLEPAGRP